MIASGVPIGASSTVQAPTKKPGTVSAMVGRFSNPGGRFSAVDASPLIRSPLIAGARPA